jgi:hypothetical protein
VEERLLEGYLGLVRERHVLHRELLRDLPRELERHIPHRELLQDLLKELEQHVLHKDPV